MALPPIVVVTIQSSIIGALSNILAQAITAHQNSVCDPQRLAQCNS